MLLLAHHNLLFHITSHNLCHYMNIVSEKVQSTWGGFSNFDPAHNSGESFRDGFVWAKPFQYLSFSSVSKDLSSKWNPFELHRCYFFEKSNILVFWLHFLTKSHCKFIKENMVSSTYLPRNLSEGAQILNPSSLEVSGGFLFCRIGQN